MTTHMCILAFAIFSLCISRGLGHEGHSHSPISAVAPAPSPVIAPTAVRTANFTALNATDAAVVCPELLYFLAATEAAQLTDLLSSTPSNVTVLAPSNGAFKKAVTLLGGNDSSFLSSPQLGGILAYHILDTADTSLANGARIPSLYYSLPVTVKSTASSLQFFGGSNTNATAIFHIPTPKGDVYVIDNILDRRQLPAPGTPGSAVATPATLAEALQTLTMLPQAEAKAAELQNAAATPAAAVAG